MSAFGGRVRLHGFQCSAQLLRLKRAGAVRGRALQLFQQGNGSEAVQAAAVDQLHARCGKNGKDLDLRCIQLGQKRRKSCLLRGLIRQGRVDRLGRLIQLLCPVGGFSVIGKGTAITIMSFWEPLREEEDTAAQAASSEGSCPRMLRPLPHRVRSPLFFFRYKAGREKTTRTARTISVIVFCVIWIPHKGD